MEWLNETFSEFDGGIFDVMHLAAESAGSVLTPIMKFITLIGEKGVVFFLAGLILMLFCRTRRLGVCIFGAVGCGAILTTFILKDLVGRIRPFEADALFRSYWEFLGSPAEDGFCFPSGHVTAIMAAATALFLLCPKKWSFIGFFGVLLMAFARVYLIAHYATDVIAAILVGAVAGVIAWLITKAIFRLLEQHRDQKFCAFCLDFNLPSVLRKG